jgi:hypothetical protein
LEVDLPYLWSNFGRHRRRRYYFYRRDGKFAAIKSPDGRRLEPGDTGFLEAYQRMHESFEQSPTAAPARTSTKTGTIAHLIEAYRASPNFKQRAPKTQKDYGRYLDMLKEKHGHRSIAKLPRDAVFAIRDAYQSTPRTANYIVAVLRRILSFAENRKQSLSTMELMRPNARIAVCKKPQDIRNPSPFAPAEPHGPTQGGFLYDQ